MLIYNGEQVVPDKSMWFQSRVYGLNTKLLVGAGDFMTINE